jgi:bifunctional UDP-N-acetylglucosamine pyrophosphorylase/glucosamine-1-phosphate N-acetyltransferase
VEELDADEEQKTIGEVGTSFYCFSASALRKHVPNVDNANAKGEYYLTDLVGMINESGGVCTAVVFEDFELLLGVNDRWQLAEVSKIMRMRILREFAMSGVTIDDPDSTFIGADVMLGPDCIIRPMTVLEGRTTVGAACELGPATRVTDSTVGERCVIHMSHVNRVELGDDCRVGPFANLRPHTVLGRAVKIGNFVEVKASSLGEESSVSHLAYIGDATVGARTNIGAGTITCNYDGFSKHGTEIGNDAFIGSNSTLIAPLSIGNGAFIAAGSTVTQDVPDDALAIGRSRQEIKESWAEKWRNRKKKF